MSLESYSYRGIKTLDNIEGTDGNGILLGSDVSLDFKNTRVAIGHLGNASSQGKVTVHSLPNTTSGTWQTSQTITEPSASNGSFFGYAVSMNWTGTRIAVGAPKKSNGTVYVFDATGTGSNVWETYVSNTITSSSTSSNGNFGFSISLGQDIDTTLAIGNPNDNRVEIWKLSNHSWSQAYSNIGDDLDNKVPYNSAQDAFTTINNSIDNIKSLQYGFSVKLAPFGTHVIIGAPGSVLNEITSSNSDNNGQQRNNIFIGASPSYEWSGGYSFLPFSYRQSGYARIFTTTDDWSTSGNVSQLGQTLSGLNYVNPGEYVNGGGLTFPTFGYSVSMNYDGTIIAVGAPRLGHAYVYEYSTITNLWEQRGSAITTAAGSQNGLRVCLDYTGSRLATSMVINWGFPAVNNAQFYVVDWSGSAWVEAQLAISSKDPGVGHGQSTGTKQFAGYAIDMTDGNQVASSQLWWGDDDMVNDNHGDGNTLSNYLGSYPSNQNAEGRVQFYYFTLTSSFNGNTLFEGYVVAQELKIGTNDNATDNEKPKRLSFGGTSGDNFYDETLIENRVISSDVAELLLHKHHDTNEKVDRIRLKASEIHLDHMRMYHSVYQDGREGKDVRTPRFILDQYGTIAIGNLWTGHESSAQTTSLSETYFDIKAETQIRDKLNVNFKNRSKLLSGRKGYVYMNTRCEDLISSSQIIDETPGFVRVMSINNGVNYSSTEKAFEFTNTNSGIGISNMAGEGHGNWDGDDGMMMFWLKLKDDHSNYTSSNALCSWGETLSTASGVYKGGCLQLTSTGLTLNFGSAIGTRSNTYTFTRDTWYHIGIRFPTETTNMAANGLSINGSWVNLSGTVTNPSSSPGWDSVGWHFGYNGRLAASSIPGPAGTYIGNMIFLEDLDGDLLTYAYNDGPPSECLSVGGEALIENKLGIGSNTAPTKTLEVTGNVNVISGNIYQNGILQRQWPATSSGVDIYHNIGKVGIGTSTPGVPLDISYSSGTNGIQLTAGSTSQNSIIQVKAASGGSGDPLLSLSCDDGSGSAWCVGIDNSDSDKFVIANDENNLTSSQYIKCGGDEIDLKKRIVINGSAGTNGQVLTSGGSGGTVSWTTVSGGGGGSSPWTTSGTNVYIQNADIGIETTSPNAELDVNGHIHCKSIQTGTSRYEQHLVKGNLIRLRFTSGASSPDTQSEMDTYFESLSSGTKALSRPRHAAASSLNTFAETFEGYLKVTTAGTHYFGLNSDDASDMYINGTQVAYWYGGHGHNSTTTTPGGNTGDIYLKTGYHKIFVRFQENGGGEALYSLWKEPGDSSWSEIPGDNCFYDYIRYN